MPSDVGAAAPSPPSLGSSVKEAAMAAALAAIAAWAAEAALALTGDSLMLANVAAVSLPP
jgi:hypothetical protein